MYAVTSESKQEHAMNDEVFFVYVKYFAAPMSNDSVLHFFLIAWDGVDFIIGSLFYIF